MVVGVDGGIVDIFDVIVGDDITGELGAGTSGDGGLEDCARALGVVMVTVVVVVAMEFGDTVQSVVVGVVAIAVVVAGSSVEESKS